MRKGNSQYAVLKLPFAAWDRRAQRVRPVILETRSLRYRFLELELKMLEARLLAPQSTIFGTVRKLESKGYTRLVQSENDRRVKTAELTEEGKNLCLLAIEDKKKDNEVMVAGLTAEEQIVLRLLLSKMARTMLNIRMHEHRCVAE